jgi:hypothetical protein
MGTATATPETKPDPSGKAWPRKTFAVAAAAVLVISTVGYAAGRGLIWPHRTDRINEPFSDYGGGTLGFKAAPGDERIFLDFFQHKPVDDVITIEQVTSGIARGPVTVLEVALAIRRPGEPFLAPTTYPVDPTTAWRECNAQFITDPTGYEVQPGEVVMLVQKLRFTEPGAGKLAPAEIIFRRNGVRFRSHPGMHLKFEVDERFDKTIPKHSWKRACDNPHGVF